jgi:hypothetical protein
MSENNEFQISQNISSKPIDSFEKNLARLLERLLVILFILSGFTTVRERADFILIVLNSMKEDFTNGKVNMEKYYHKLGTNGDVSLLNLSKKSHLQCLKL